MSARDEAESLAKYFDWEPDSEQVSEVTKLLESRDKRIAALREAIERGCDCLKLKRIHAIAPDAKCDGCMALAADDLRAQEPSNISKIGNVKEGG